MGTKRDLQAIEARRIAGARLLKRKVPQAEVARELGVSRQAVSVWARQRAEANGAVGKLKAKPLGRPKRLDAQQRQALSRMWVAGALQAGFTTALWTASSGCARSSSASSAWRTARPAAGSCCATWASRHKSPTSAPCSATRRRS